ncbi:hypothetical protein BpHYR1_041526 [Brachionus plicatilis]|uniref:Uncharacterized protein n=1 Tax=Brachionus plicatilis TaxID=10195 RepID=A0A3M7S4A5_BRAPC|nr:hypothetical protein BpHYR1_041526 [Brachionus plicatilis]
MDSLNLILLMQLSATFKVSSNIKKKSCLIFLHFVLFYCTELHKILKALNTVDHYVLFIKLRCYGFGKSSTTKLVYYFVSTSRTVSRTVNWSHCEQHHQFTVRLIYNKRLIKLAADEI